MASSGERSAAVLSREDATQEQPVGVTQREVEDIEERSSPRTPVIYEIVRRLGEEEMARPAISLWWSGVAAGLSISFSLLGQAILRTHLPNAPWQPLVSCLGYSVGFIMVVLSRQQLFTESTITAVLPLLADFGFTNVRKLVRLWSIVLVANFVGTFVAACFFTFAPAITPALYAGMLEISRQILGHGWLELFFRGIPAGFVIAAMVWLLPSADTAQFYVITLMTYVIAAGEFMHIIAGSVEAFILVLHGDIGLGAIGAGFIMPVLLGNIIGGTVLFGLISYGQVMREIELQGV